MAANEALKSSFTNTERGACLGEESFLENGGKDDRLRKTMLSAEAKKTRNGQSIEDKGNF